MARTMHSSAVPDVVLRANLYMQNLLRQRAAILDGQYVEPLADTAVTLLDVRDASRRRRGRRGRVP